MALQQEVWSTQIQELLYPSNSILAKTTDSTQFLHFKTVHMPQAGLNGSVVKNRSLGGSLASTYQRTDADLTYNIDSYSVDPIIISELETYQISYDKRKSILFNAMKNLETVQTDTFLYAIAPTVASSSATTRTSGALSANSLCFNYAGDVATGTRKQVTFADIMSMKSQLDKQNVEQEGRVMLAPSDIYNNDLLMLPNLLNAYQFATVNLGQAVASTGAVSKVAGFEVFTRPASVVYSSGGTLASLVQGLDGSSQPNSIYDTDNWAVLAWHPAYVAFAKGQVDVFYQEVVAQAYGSLISFNVFAGGANIRTDKKGVVALIQTA